ncbi:unnamed protein product [Danaus chrysippus]|uniref:(African queen) hypothetical protein n=1 Tax=Danaus chrysippus TaxID=151541 RepID=A0A8J2R7Q6_9NEOP|nr:unnamed protein product [Danaus chrysippus]
MRGRGGAQGGGWGHRNVAGVRSSSLALTNSVFPRGPGPGPPDPRTPRTPRTPGPPGREGREGCGRLPFVMLEHRASN